MKNLNKNQEEQDCSVSEYFTTKQQELYPSLVTEVKDRYRKYNTDNCYAAAILLLREGCVSANFLESTFGWGKGYARDVLTMLEKMKIIEAPQILRNRKILVKEDDIVNILSANLNVAKNKTDNCWIKKAYIEIQIPKQTGDADFETFNLNPEIARQFNVGDKWLIERTHINRPDFWMNIISDCHQLKFRQNIQSYFSHLSNNCFIQIVERIFNENCIELHGTVISSDGKFYE